MLTRQVATSGDCYRCDLRDTKALCEWRYVGRGLQYQLLAGPVFTVLFSVSGVPLGNTFFYAEPLY